MSVKETENEIIIEIPNFPPFKIQKSQIVKIEEAEPPDEICKLLLKLHKEGFVFAGTTIDGKISYFNVKPGEKCLRIILKDGRQMYISKPKG